MMTRTDHTNDLFDIEKLVKNTIHDMNILSLGKYNLLHTMCLIMGFLRRFLEVR